jgi:Fic family protein
MLNNLLTQIDGLQQEINKFRPFSPSFLKQLEDYYKIGLTYSSNALEGNSLTESETKVVIEDGLTIGGKPMKDHFEAMGHAAAYAQLFNLSKKMGFSEEDVKNLHKLFYQKIDEAQAGAYRQEQVIITGSKYSCPAPADVPRLMMKFVADTLDFLGKFHAVEAAATIHKDFVFIHPFIDGNGRIARLLMNLCLLQKGYQVTIIPPILRAQYIACLEKAHVDDSDFKIFIAERVLESQKEMLRLLQNK